MKIQPVPMSSAVEGVFPESKEALHTLNRPDSTTLAAFEFCKVSHTPRHEIIYEASSGCLVDSESYTEEGETSLPYK